MKKEDCIFCKLDNYVLENDLAYAVFDINPQSKGHMLVILKEHKENILKVTQTELDAMYSLVDDVVDYLYEKYKPDGYNVMTNVGKAAGQTVMHVHMHVIPAYDKDRQDV